MDQGGIDAITSWVRDVVVVIGGGTIWETPPQAPDMSDFLRAEHARGGAAIGGICGGATLALGGRAGLLDRVAHTSNAVGFLSDNVPGYGGQARYLDQPAAVSDEGGVMTASGLAPPVSFCAEVFAAAGLEADKVAQFRAMMAAEHR